MQKIQIIFLILICNISYSEISFFNKAKIQYEKKTTIKLNCYLRKT